MIDYSLVIQAGGQSTRMGQDKGLIPFGDGMLLEYILSQLKSCNRETYIISNNEEEYQIFGLPIFGDVIPGVGALGGVYSALYYAKTEYILLLAVDMPFINLDLLNYLVRIADNYDVVIPKVSKKGFLEPFRAVYSRRCLPPIQNMIVAGERKVISFFDSVSVRYVEVEEIQEVDPEGRTFFNINTPEDLEKARAWLTG
jgi:molybdopterin-guanine dinucleotide biosynthesis protein A